MGTFPAIEYHCNMIVLESHIPSHHLVEGAVGSGEDDVSWEEVRLHVLGEFPLEGDGVAVGWGGGGEELDEGLHDG